METKTVTQEQQECFDKITQEALDKIIQALDKVSEQGIRKVLYSIIKNYPDESAVVIDAIILKQKGII